MTGRIRSWTSWRTETIYRHLAQLDPEVPSSLQQVQWALGNCGQCLPSPVSEFRAEILKVATQMPPKSR